MRVTAIHDGVTGCEKRNQFLDNGIHGATGLDHDEDCARSSELLDELCQRVRAGKGTFGAICLEELIHFACSAVVDGNREAVTRNVSREVLTHDRKSGQSEVWQL